MMRTGSRQKLSAIFFQTVSAQGSLFALRHQMQTPIFDAMESELPRFVLGWNAGDALPEQCYLMNVPWYRNACHVTVERGRL